MVKKVSIDRSAITKIQAIIIAVVVIVAAAATVFMLFPRPAKPVTLRILGSAEAHCFAKKEAVAPYYEEKFGVKVEVEIFPYEECHEKQVLELSTHSSSYDIMCHDTWFTVEYKANGWLYSLEELARKYPDVPKPDWDSQKWAFGEGLHKLRWPPEKGEIYVVSNDVCIQIMAYRKDLFVKYGIVDEAGNPKPPETWDEFMEDVKKLTVDEDGDGEIDIYGAVWHCGAGGAGFSDWMEIRAQLGGFDDDIVFDENLKPTRLNDPLGVQALQMYLDMQPYAVPGTTAYSYGESATLFMEGKAATFVDWSVLFFQVEDPEVSKVAGKVGYAIVPYTVEPRFDPSGWVLGVNKWTEHPKEAYEFISWMTTLEAQNVMLDISPTAYRIEPYHDPKFLEKFPLMEAIKEYAKCRPYYIPQVPEFPHVYRIVTEQMALAVEGKKSAKEAMDTAAAELYTIMEEAGYYD